MSQNNLMDVNDALGIERYHTFYRKGTSSRIDSVWCNKAALNIVSEVKMFTRNGVNSDHVPTLLSLRCEPKVATVDERVSYCSRRTKRSRDGYNTAKV